MFRNYLAAAWRSASRDRFYAVLNVLGLGLGFAAAILIGLFVRNELSFDRFLPDIQNVYRVQLTTADLDSPPLTSFATPNEIGAELKLDFPEILAVARYAKLYMGLRHGNVEAEEFLHWVDPDFLSVLKYPMLRGDRSSALAEPDSIVLTRSTAEKYFGTIDCLGQTLEVDRLHPMRVTGIVEDPPTTSTVQFVGLLSGKSAWGKLALLDANTPIKGQLFVSLFTYVKLRPGVTPDSLAARLPAFALAHYPNVDGTKSILTSIHLKPVADVHLHPYNPDSSERDDQAQTVYAIAATGILVMLLAGINFVNLVTARATRRAVEVGVRKALGAMRRQLMVQFMGESLLYALAGMMLGVAMAEIYLPILNAFLDRQLSFDYWRDPILVIGPVVTAILFGLAAGLYPAVILSRFPPALVLKARSGASIGGGKMRLALVLFQFSVTISLVIVTTVIYRQNDFATSRALGFDKDLVLTVNMVGMAKVTPPDGLELREQDSVDTLRARLATVPGVKSVAGSFSVPMLTQSFTLDYRRTGLTDGQVVASNYMPIDFDYFSVYGLPILAGRDFSRAYAEDQIAHEDKTKLCSVIINQAEVRALGFADASAAIGQELQSEDPTFPLRRHRIIGVVPDFPLRSIRQPVPPTVFLIDLELDRVLNLKLTGANLPETLRGIDVVWHGVVPGTPIDREFLDDRLAGLYLDVTREGVVFSGFAGIAVAIGCLGLVGLSAYTAERRTKEIGIRKALGASAVDVTRMLVWQFTVPVLVANIFAWPVAWWFMRRWLDGFAYRLDLDALPFITAGLGALLIAVVTTIFHAIQVAHSRPVAALRYE